MYVQACPAWMSGILISASDLMRCVQVLAAPLMHPVPTVGYVVQVRCGGVGGGGSPWGCLSGAIACPHSVVMVWVVDFGRENEYVLCHYRQEKDYGGKMELSQSVIARLRSPVSSSTRMLSPWVPIIAESALRGHLSS